MSAKMLALTSLFLATAFAQTGWKEFTSTEGNFRVLFPEDPNNKRSVNGISTVQRRCWQRIVRIGLRRLPAGHGLGKRGERGAGFDLERLGRVRSRREAHLSRRLSREIYPVRRTEHQRRTHHLLRGATPVCTTRFCSEERVSAGELFYISKLVSTSI